MGTLQGDVSTCMAVPRCTLRSIKNISEKFVRKTKTRILFSTAFSWIPGVFWGNVEKDGGARNATDYNIIRRMRFECWITKATDTHWEYAILTVFLQRQWLHESASMLRHSTLPVLLMLDASARKFHQSKPVSSTYICLICPHTINWQRLHFTTRNNCSCEFNVVCTVHHVSMCW